MRRDRHGRLAHADSDERRRPPTGFRVRDSRRFGALVEEAISLLPEHLAQEVTPAEVVVVDVPGPEAVVDEDGQVSLARFVPARGRVRPQLVVHRRPLEHRATDRDDLVQLLRLAIGLAVARALGLSDDELGDLDDG